MNDQLKRLTNENEGLYGEVREGQEKLRLSNSQTSKMVMELENLRNQMMHYSQENEELKRRNMDSGELAKKLNEYENKIALLSQEVERLTIQLDKKTN